ncbi:MAG: DUF2553 family protein [Bacillota bacterium]
MANHKRDVTKFLNVKLKEDHLLLLHKDEVVAKLPLKNKEELMLFSNYEIKGDKVCKKAENPSKVDSYVESCDLGWC